MTLFRPEVTRLASRWAETAIYAGATVAAVMWLQRVAPDPYWRWGLSIAFAAIGFWFVRAASLTALASSNEHGPGIVVIDERRIAYLGPATGGFASINEIEEIAVAHTPGPLWVLGRADDIPLEIPVGAEGAERMIDAFSALPGFQAPRAISTLNAATSGHVTIWRRPGGPAPLTLAPGRPAA